MIVGALNIEITKFHTNLVPPYPRIHFMLMLPRCYLMYRGEVTAEEGLQHAVEK